MSDVNKDGGAAFPLMHEDGSYQGGMSLRDYFAALALQGFCSNPDLNKAAVMLDRNPEQVRAAYVKSAYAAADEMLKVRRL